MGCRAGQGRAGQGAPCGGRTTCHVPVEEAEEGGGKGNAGEGGLELEGRQGRVRAGALGLARPRPQAWGCHLRVSRAGRACVAGWPMKGEGYEGRGEGSQRPSDRRYIMRMQVATECACAGEQGVLPLQPLPWWVIQSQRVARQARARMAHAL